MNKQTSFGKKIYKTIFIALGLLAVSIGAVVRFIPGIPTTPFFLLALYCFNKSSDRLSEWLKNTYFYKKYLANYINNRAMTLKQKITIQIFASTMMIISFVNVQNLIFRIVMVILFVAHHYVFIFRIKTYKPDAPQPAEAARQTKCDKKKNMVHKMISLYCRKGHHSQKGTLCSDCIELLEYAHKRSDSCPHIESKTFCSRCKSPCYSIDMKEKIQTVMRWTGPRMMLYHPVETVRYLCYTKLSS